MIFPPLMTCKFFTPDTPVLPRHKAHFFPKSEAQKSEAYHKAELKISLKAPLMRATRRSSQYNSSFAAPQSAFFAKTEARHKTEF